MTGGRRRLAAVALAALLVLSGCSVGAPLEGGERGDPASDQLGWENGYWYDDSLSVTLDDGLNETERRRVVARTMARVERIRDLEFESRVPVEVITREQYREQRSGNGSDSRSAFNRWNNQVWEAIFIVDEDAHVSETLDSVFSSSVQGYYSPSKDEIVVVSGTETPTIDRATLSHELTHALQDQHFGLGASRDTQDGQLAADGLVEGDANYVEAAYERRCREGQWSCLDRPERGGGGGGGTFNRGLFTTVYAPYAAGPGYIDELRSRGGWDAVDAAYDQYPTSTEQVIHPERYPDDEPARVTLPDRSGADWRRFDVDPVYDTVGEASIYAMFWANGQLEDHAHYNYSHPLSTGWDGDRVVPYRNGDEYGYVWRTVWDSPAEAREFAEGYRTLLRSHDAEARGDGVYVVPESDPYADAFHVSRSGDTVTVVNAPTVGQLDAVHALR
ncbi:MAG: Hvo_1808 family surface protein [Haloglomus sp.]